MNRMMLVVVLLCSSTLAEGQSFYREPHGLFSTRPSETASLQSIDRLGPVGLGIELLQPAFVMRI